MRNKNWELKETQLAIKYITPKYHATAHDIPTESVSSVNSVHWFKCFQQHAI